MRSITPRIFTIIGILGTFVSIYVMPNSVARTVFFIVFFLFTFVGLFGMLSQKIDLSSAWSILRQCKRLGIRRIYVADVSVDLPAQMSKAKSIRIMAVSANALIKNRKNEIISALREQRAFIRVLLAQPNSQFVLDVEESESVHRVGQISPEIQGVERLLSEYVEEAASGKSIEEIGKVKIGYYTTHLLGLWTSENGRSIERSVDERIA